jgi:hypothetical protein
MNAPPVTITDPWGDTDFELAWPWANAVLDSVRPHMAPPLNKDLPPAEETPLVFVMRSWCLMLKLADSLPLA